MGIKYYIRDSGPKIRLAATQVFSTDDSLWLRWIILEMTWDATDGSYYLVDK